LKLPGSKPRGQLDELLDGNYDSQIADFYIIDCRFDYEYNGGHIAGAVNINTTSGVEEFLLGPGPAKPKQSVSGDPAKKTVLVFHCEFSVKRAPTLFVIHTYLSKHQLTLTPFAARSTCALRIGP
jgi:rhodanese-related sulfurtransferase